MSNDLIDIGEDLNTEPRIKVKPTIPIEDIPEEFRGHPLTAADMKKISQEIEANVRLAIAEAEYNGRTQVINKSKLVITDFSNINQDDIYNPDVAIEARPFMAGDPLKVKLLDSNYEARWVSLNSQRLGYMKSIGFSYVISDDLAKDLESEVSSDASGHFTINDVVLMKIQKSRYYPALKAAHLRGEQVVNTTKASARGQHAASEFMARSTGAEFSDATQAGQMNFYNPAVTSR